MKTLTADDWLDIQACIHSSVPAEAAAELCRPLTELAQGRHEVIDRATTHRAVTVESLRVLKQALSGTIPAAQVNAALAEIEEKLRDA